MQGMALRTCPPDPADYADAFLLKHLSPAEEEAHQRHLAICAACRQLVKEAETFRNALRDAVALDPFPCLN
jgi:anti-sigma factor RsiW